MYDCSSDIFIKMTDVEQLVAMWLNEILNDC